MADFKTVFTADTKNFEQGVDRINKNISGVKQSASSLNSLMGAGIAGGIAGIAAGAVSAVMSGVSSAISQLTDAVVSFAKSASAAAMEAEDMAVELKVLTGSAATAGDLLAKLTEFGTKTPFEVKDLTKATAVLIGFGVQTKDVMGILKNLGDISGGSAERLQSLALVYGQVSSLGKLQGQDKLQMINAGFNPTEEIAKNMGISVQQVTDLMSKGEIGAEQLTKAIQTATAVGGKYYGMMIEKSQTLSGKISNMADAWTQLQKAFGEGLNAGVGDIVSVITNMLPTLTDSMRELGRIVGEILSVIAEHLPDSLERIKAAMSSEDGIAGAILDGIIHAVQSDRFKNALKAAFGDTFSADNIGTTIGSVMSKAVGSSLTTFSASNLLNGLGILSPTKGQEATTGLNGVVESAIGSFLNNVLIQTGILEGKDKLPIYEYNPKHSKAPIRPGDIPYQGEMSAQAKAYGRTLTDPAEISKVLKDSFIEAAESTKRNNQRGANSWNEWMERITDKGVPDLLKRPDEPTKNPSLYDPMLAGRKPALTSLASIGGGNFYTGQSSMMAIQKITNQWLQKIERNTAKSVNPVAVW